MKKPKAKGIAKLLTLVFALTLLIAAFVTVSSAEGPAAEVTFTSYDENLTDDVPGVPAVKTFNDIATALWAYGKYNGGQEATIKLLQDCTIPQRYSINPANSLPTSLTIDLNGYTLDSNGSDARIVIYKDVTLNIVGHGKILLNSPKNLIESGAVTVDGANVFNSCARITGTTGTIEIVHNAGALFYLQETMSDKACEIKNVKFTSTVDGTVMSTGNNVIFDMENVEFNFITSTNYPMAFNNNVVVNMNNVTINNTSTSGHIISFPNALTLNMTGCEINAPNAATATEGMFTFAGTQNIINANYVNFSGSGVSLFNIGTSGKCPKTVNIENSKFDSEGGSLFTNTPTSSTTVTASNFLVNGYYDAMFAVEKNEVGDASDIASLWNNNSSQTSSSYVSGGSYTQWIVNTDANTTGNPMALTGLGVKNSTQAPKWAAATGNIIVHSIDIRATAENKFLSAAISLCARDSSNWKASNEFLSISGSGVISASGGTSGGTSSVQLAYDSWNTVTIVIDTNYNNALTVYAFANGIYIGELHFADNSSLAEGTASTTAITGIKFRTYGGQTSASGDLLFNNSKSYSFAGNGSNIDAGVASLYAIGYDAYKNSAYFDDSYNISVSGIPTPDINKALADAAEYGLNVELLGNVTEEQNVQTDGAVISNGHTIALADTSYLAKLTDGIYDFKAVYSTYYVTYRFNLGNGTYKDVNVLVNNTPAPALTEEELAIYNSLEKGFLKADGKYYQSKTLLGWSDDSENVVDVNYTFVPVTLEAADAFMNGEAEAVALYPSFSSSGAKLYDAIIVDIDDGSFIRGINPNVGTWWGGGRSAVALKYGEVLKLQRNVSTQASLANGDSFIGGEKHPTLGKVYGIDLNGYTLTFDVNVQQGQVSQLYNQGWFQVKEGETLNVYSSVAGGKISAYATNISTLGTSELTADGVTSVAGTHTGKTQEEYDAFKAANYTRYITNNRILYVTVSALENGSFTVTEKYVQIDGIGSGYLFDMIDADNANINIGAFGSYAGSNLTLEASSIFRGQNGSAGGKITVDGATLIRNADGYSRYTALFYMDNYAGSVEIKNSLIVTPMDNDFIDGTLYEGEAAIGAVTVTDSTVLVKNDGEAILFGEFANTLTFTNVVTNGAINALENASVILGDGNLYALSDANTAEGIVNAFNDSQMTVSGSTSYTISYVTINPDNLYNNNNFDYLNVTETKTLPALGYKSTAAANTATLTYNDLDGNAILSEVYVKGTAARATEVNVPEKSFTVINVTVEGFDVPATVTEDAVLNPTYEATVKTAGIKANVAVYSEFGVNIYVPAEFAEYMNILIDGEAVTPSSTVVDGVTYNKYQVFRQAYQSETDVEVTFTAAEAGITATKTSYINVVSYAQKVLDQNGAEVDTDLMYYMLNYAQEANKYFDTKTASDTIAKILAITAPTATYDYNSENDSVNAAIEEAVSEIALDVKADDLKYVFTLNGTAAVSVKLNGKEYKAEGNTITVGGLKVYDFAKDVTFVIDGTEYNYKFANCVNSYKTASDENAQATAAIVEAFYQYAKAATAYKNAQTAK